MRRLLPLLLAPPILCASAHAPAVTLHSEFAGSNNCLDIVNAGNQDQVRMARCGPYTGRAGLGERLCAAANTL